LAKDYIQAYLWVAPSAASGHQPTDKRRAALAAKMAPERIAEAQKITRNWKPTTLSVDVPQYLHRLQPAQMRLSSFLFSDLLFSPDVNYPPRPSMSFELDPHGR
jgi:hypothetical protein